ncbi:MAG: acetyltransferase [Firmicutes bacterium]|nr:acetyltransferase [Bacillota bacterium]
MKDIVVFGAGGHAKVVIDMIEKQGDFKVIGLIDPYKTQSEKQFGYSILANHEDFSILNKVFGGIVAIGDNWIRHRVTLRINNVDPDFNFITVIHPFASIARGVKIGKGTVIMAGAVINSDTLIGEHCIVNTNASIDHDSMVGHYVSMAPNTSTGGRVKIDDYAAIGLGANIIHNRAIGKHTVIGAGSTVIRDIPPYVVACGTPCKIIRERKEGDAYL